MLEVKDSTQLSSTSNDPRFQPAEWVVDAVKRDLCKPEEPWIRHPIACLPGLISEMVGAFDRSKIQHFYSQLERVRTNAKKVKDEGIRNGALEDLDALESAGKVLRRLLEKEEQARPQTDLFQPAPVPPTPSSGVGDQHQPSPPTHVEEAEEPSQPEPTPPPPAPVSPAPEPSLPAPCFPRVDLMDPRHIASAHEFVKAVTSARQHLWQLSDEQEIKKVATYAQLLEALAKTIELGKEFEIEGKALRFECFFRASQLRGPVSPGPVKKGSPPPPVLKGFESKTDRNLLGLMGKLAPDKFESLLQKGVETKTLSEKTFRPTLSDGHGQLSGAPDNSKTGQTQPESQPDFRLFFRALKDITKNPVPYEQGQYAKANEHEWANIVMGGYRSTIRFFALKLLELLGPDDCAPGGGYRMPRIPSESEVLSPSEETTLSI